MICFGIGSHLGQDEVFIGKYKIFYIFTKEVEKYILILEGKGVFLEENQKIVYDNFSDDSCGERFVIGDKKFNIYTMLEELKQEGLYFAERRVDR